MKRKLQTLKGKTIVLGVTGSIAAVETVKLARELRRKGAEVVAVMSGAACGILNPEALTYACSRPAITSITGMVEHVEYCGIGGEADLLLIAPATANTVCKIAAGIDDTPVTTFATTAIGRSMPVVVVPAMHESMYSHPAVKDAIHKLESWGISVLSPKMEEDRAKIPDTAAITLATEREIMKGPLSGKRVLVTSGACVEEIDDVRVMTTRSGGAMGREMALAAFRLGAEVTVVHGGEEIPLVRNIHTGSAAEMRDRVMALMDAERQDYYVGAAAISDFAPERFCGKIPSGNAMLIRLNVLPKLIEEVKERYDVSIIAFKLGRNEEAKARQMIESGISLVAVNAPETMGAATGEYRLLTEEGGETKVAGMKEEVASAIWKEIL